MQLENKITIVTGSGRNIGEGIAKRYADEGAKVAIVDKLADRTEAVAAAINASHPGAALAVECDVTDSASVQAMVAKVISEWGHVDVLVNNVGVVDRTNILELPESEWDRVIAVSLTSVFLVTKYVATKMVEHGQGGRIINIASTSGYQSRPNATAYPAAKAGGLHLTRTLAVQLAPYHIRVNSVTPNRVLTEAEPGAPTRATNVTNLIGRQGTPADIAGACVFLAGPDADFITGIDLPVEGGVLAG
ncbi:MAG: glucose 1-dehydrogenase [Chloroflexi bacterium]|nr:glucose 1-dehydrogenase [Chloroflexota bacterium]